MRVPALLLFLLLLAALPAPAMTLDDARLLASVQQRMDAGEYARAAALLRERLQSGPGDAVLHLALGNALYMKDDLAGAHTAYAEAHRLAPDDPAACRNLALTAYGLERWAESGPLFERAWALAEPRDPMLLLQAGAAWFQAGRYDEAVRALDRGRAERPLPDASWLGMYAAACTQAGSHAKGIAAIISTLRAHPGDPELWRVLSDAELRGGRYDRAAAALEALIRLEGASPARLVDLYAGTGLPGVAALRLDAGNADAPNLDRMADLYLLAHRPGEALQVMQRAQELQPTSSRIKRMGLIAFQSGNEKTAIELLLKYLTQHPKDHAACLVIAQAALTIGNTALAARILERIPADSDHHETAMALLELLALDNRALIAK